MIQSENIAELLAELAEVQSELPTMPKGSQAYGYKYTDLDTITQTVKPILHKHGIGYIQSVGGLAADGMTLTTRLFNKKGQYIEDTAALPAITSTKNNAAQTLGMSITYMRRYALCAMLGITSDEDVDANAGGAADARERNGRQERTPPKNDARSPEPKAGSMGGAGKQTQPKGASEQKPTAAQKPAAKKGDYSFSEEEGAEMREMFESGFFPPEEQEAIRESLRKRESTAADVLWATRRKYVTRAKAQAKKMAENVSAEAERGASEAFDGGLPPDGGDGQQEIF